MYLDGSRSKIIKWVAEGLSDRVIGEYLRVSASTVRAWREKNGVVRTAARASPQLSTARTVSYCLPSALEPTRFPAVTSLVRARRLLSDAIDAASGGRAGSIRRRRGANYRRWRLRVWLGASVWGVVDDRRASWRPERDCRVCRPRRRTCRATGRWVRERVRRATGRRDVSACGKTPRGC